MPQTFTGHKLPVIDDTEDEAGCVRYHSTIAEQLSERGYETIGFTPNPFTSRQFGFDAGFDNFEDFLDYEDSLGDRLRSYAKQQFRDGSIPGARFLLNMLGKGDITTSWRDYYDELLETVGEADEPFFLWVFLLEPHWPYLPSKYNRDGVSRLDLFQNWKRAHWNDKRPDNTTTEKLRQLYKQTIKDVNDFVGQLETDLAEHDPAFVFHSDHGEAFGEHGNWGHRSGLYSENVWVPFEVWNIDRSATVTEPVTLRSIPSILENIAEGDTDSITDAATFAVSAHEGVTDASLVFEEEMYYPSGNIESSDVPKEFADQLLSQAQESVREERRVRNAARTSPLSKL
jgi:arylsulfatase